jgi:hypothetical protein
LPGVGEKSATDDLVGELGAPSVGAQGLLDYDIYESLYNPGKVLLLGSWRDARAAGDWTPRTSRGGALRHRQVRIVRDYGMFDRREAPQYYPDVRR